MVGFPVTAGFISKVVFASSSFDSSNPVMMYATLFALIASTILNAVYFIHTMITIYSKDENHYEYNAKIEPKFVVSNIVLVGLNVALGVIPYVVLHVISHGVEHFF